MPQGEKKKVVPPVPSPVPIRPPTDDPPIIPLPSPIRLKPIRRESVRPIG
jgi:hypothetical protein